ncbi:hypothetical protein U91I_03108 [alpha proteobacterium U9-1i]|nr:hypothetical protein U91I_03108 [alpha proteobacterium U9-1i]
MPLSLYDVTVPTFQQILGAVSGLLDKAEAHCAEKNTPHADIINARLHPEMLPFAYQVKSTVVHSLGALQSLPRGSFSPDMAPSPDTFAALKEKLSSASVALARFTPAEINAFEGRDMRFSIKDNFHLDFTAENFLMSFSMPNFYFHATTAYDILRSKGVALGKKNFMGKLRTK